MLVLPPASDGGVLLLGDEPQDSQGLEVVRQGRGSTTPQVMDMEGTHLRFIPVREMPNATRAGNAPFISAPDIEGPTADQVS